MSDSRQVKGEEKNGSAKCDEGEEEEDEGLEAHRPFSTRSTPGFLPQFTGVRAGNSFHSGRHFHFFVFLLSFFFVLFRPPAAEKCNTTAAAAPAKTKPQE